MAYGQKAHIIPRQASGGSEEDNILWSCPDCNPPEKSGDFIGTHRFEGKLSDAPNYGSLYKPNDIDELWVMVRIETALSKDSNRRKGQASHLVRNGMPEEYVQLLVDGPSKARDRLRRRVVGLARKTHPGIVHLCDDIPGLGPASLFRILHIVKAFRLHPKTSRRPTLGNSRSYAGVCGGKWKKRKKGVQANHNSYVKSLWVQVVPDGIIKHGGPLKIEYDRYKECKIESGMKRGQADFTSRKRTTDIIMNCVYYIIGNHDHLRLPEGDLEWLEDLAEGCREIEAGS